jgi:hypothetical protein
MNLTCPFKKDLTVVRINVPSKLYQEDGVLYFSGFRDVNDGNERVNTTKDVLEARDVSAHPSDHLARLVARILKCSSAQFGDQVNMVVENVSIEVKAEPVNIDAELAEVIRSHALSKLSLLEIELLELGRFATYDKLKNHNVDN